MRLALSIHSIFQPICCIKGVFAVIMSIRTKSHLRKEG